MWLSLASFTKRGEAVFLSINIMFRIYRERDGYTDGDYGTISSAIESKRSWEKRFPEDHFHIFSLKSENAENSFNFWEIQTKNKTTLQHDLNY